MDVECASTKQLWETLIPLATAIVTGIVTFAVTRWTERRKAMDELAAAYDQELRKERIGAYKDLWALLESFALYSPQGVTYGDLPGIAENMRSWYFRTGGLFVSAAARERYFALIWAIEQVWKGCPADSRSLRINASSLHPDDAKKDEEKYDSYRRGQPVPGPARTPEDHYRFLRALGSYLRTALAEDVRTRFRSLLAADGP